MLGQSQIVRYFDLCNDDKSINEVLSIYIMCKFLNGSDCAQVLRKIHYLVCFLRVTGRSHILRIGDNSFKVLSFEVALGGGRIGKTPAATKPGLELSNIFRRKASKKNCPVITDRTYGGPGTIPSFLSEQQLAHLRTLMDANTHRPAWMEQYFSARCGVLDAIAFNLPDYDSRRDTLPVYLSQDIMEGLESVGRVLHESQFDQEVDNGEVLSVEQF